MRVTQRAISSIKPYESNPRQTEAAVDHVAAAIERFGFRQPIVVDEKGIIVVGHVRYAAALKLGLKKVPVHVADDLTAEQVRAYRIADNAAAGHSEWDLELLEFEVGELSTEFDAAALGFDEDALAELLGTIEPEATPTGKDPGQSAYEEQYGVIVVCESEADQEAVYKKLTKQGLECRVVCT